MLLRFQGFQCSITVKNWWNSIFFFFFSTSELRLLKNLTVLEGGPVFCFVQCACWSYVCPSCFSAGAGRTGTFIALSNILERVKAEGLLDVFQTVKSLRMQRPHMVQTVVGGMRDSIKHAVQKLSAYSHLCCFETIFAGTGTPLHKVTLFFCFSLQEQYDFCYRVVQDFVDIFSDYANFK